MFSKSSILNAYFACDRSSQQAVELNVWESGDTRHLIHSLKQKLTLHTILNDFRAELVGVVVDRSWLKAHFFSALAQ